MENLEAEDFAKRATEAQWLHQDYLDAMTGTALVKTLAK